MGTTLTVGHASGAGDAKGLGKKAAAEALAALGARRPALALFFATSKLELGQLAAGVVDTLGEDVPVLGCSSAGEFVTDRISDGGVALSLVASDDLTVSVAVGEGLRASTSRAIRKLVTDLRRDARPPLPGATHRTVLLLSDGLAGNGEGLVDGLAMELGAGVTLVGGAAGDDAAFKETFVCLGRKVYRDAAVVAELMSRKKIGVGVQHGWCAASEPGTVTASKGGKLIAIDGRPAIEMYRAYAKKLGVTLTKENQNQFVFTHELGIVLMNDELKVRAPLSVEDDGSINCATEVPEGTQVRIVEGDHEAIIGAAKTAAERAMAGLGGQKPAGAIIFDCVARKLVLGPSFRREVEAFQAVVGAPVMGFNTYGEIARVRGQLSGFHNTTAVVAVLPA